MSLPPSRIPPSQMDARQFAIYATEVRALPREDVKTHTPAAADFTGWSADPSGDFKYIDAGSFVLLWVEADLTGTSDFAAFGVVLLPEEIRPITPGLTVQVASPPVYDNGVFVPAMAQITSAGALSMFNMNTTTFTFGNNWTASGTKGWPLGWAIVYPKF